MFITASYPCHTDTLVRGSRQPGHLGHHYGPTTCICKPAVGALCYRKSTFLGPVHVQETNKLVSEREMALPYLSTPAQVIRLSKLVRQQYFPQPL